MVMGLEARHHQRSYAPNRKLIEVPKNRQGLQQTEESQAYRIKKLS
jgi:hypothetical protein